MRALAKVGLATEYENFRLFVTDNASYNSTCAKQVKVIFTNVIQGDLCYAYDFACYIENCI